MHIELTEMLRCPEPHGEAFLVLSTGEMRGRMVRSGVLGCPICRREFPIVRGVVMFSRGGAPAARAVGTGSVDAASLQALLDLSGPGGYVVLVGGAARHAVGLAALMSGIHFIGVNAPTETEELPVLSLLVSESLIPLRQTIARAAVVGPDCLGAGWLAEARRVVLPGRRVVAEGEHAPIPDGLTTLAVGQGLFVGERR